MKSEIKTTTRHPSPLRSAYSRLFAVRKWQLFIPFRRRAFAVVPENPSVNSASKKKIAKMRTGVARMAKVAKQL